MPPAAIGLPHLLGGSVDGPRNSRSPFDGSGNAYITGYTTSTNFPLAGPLRYLRRIQRRVRDHAESTGTALHQEHTGGKAGEIGGTGGSQSTRPARIHPGRRPLQFPLSGPFHRRLGGQPGWLFAKIGIQGKSTGLQYLSGRAADDRGLHRVDSAPGSCVHRGTQAHQFFPTAFPLQAATQGIRPTRSSPSEREWRLINLSTLGGMGKEKQRGGQENRCDRGQSLPYN